MQGYVTKMAIQRKTSPVRLFESAHEFPIDGSKPNGIDLAPKRP